MADMKMKREDLRRWVKNTQEKAQRLLAHAEEISQTVFSSPDNFTSFLNLTARIHHYDAYNLLLIWERCQSASYLAGYKIWERKMPPGAQILKKEYMGKGIEIVAPFTDGSRDNSHLVWYSVSVFDISQTMYKGSLSSFDPAYIHDTQHEDFLLDAIKMVLGSQFNRSVIIKPPSQPMQELGLPGEIQNESVIVRDDLSIEELLQWLTEAMVQLAIENAVFTPPVSQLMRDSVRYCLFCIWGLNDYIRPPFSTLQLKSVASNQLPFLHQLRDTTRNLNNFIAGFYLAKRREDEDLNISDLYDLEGVNDDKLSNSQG